MLTQSNLIRACLFGSVILVLTTALQSQSKSNAEFRPKIPKAWDDAEVAAMEIPLAAPAPQVKYISASYYYSIPPAIIYKHERERYLKALQRADEDDCGPLTELLARSVRDGIHRFLMPSLAGPLSVVPLAGLADDELSRHALVAAAQRGRLRAHKSAGTWYSTPQWVKEYKASRFKRTVRVS